MNECVRREDVVLEAWGILGRCDEGESRGKSSSWRRTDLVLSNGASQALSSASAWQQANLHFWKAELCVFGGDNHIALFVSTP